jgi:hypothetical protein
LEVVFTAAQNVPTLGTAVSDAVYDVQSTFEQTMLGTVCAEELGVTQEQAEQALIICI